jgi:hypothetical protein
MYGARAVSSSRIHSLVLGSISYDADTCGVVYRAIVAGESIELKARALDVGGIRAVVMSDELESFLRPFCQADSGVARRLVRETFRVVDGEAIKFPIDV